jgi:membrane protease YdiL (CAAX protease family)
VVILLGLVIGYVRWELKFPRQFYLWAWGNLFFTCVAEEALFRGFLQRHLQRSLTGVSYGTVLALVLVSVLFGLAHYAAGMRYVILATVAGLGHGWICQCTDALKRAS